MPILRNPLKTLAAAVLAVSSSLVWAHPGHRHLDGAPGDMHLHALLPESLLGVLILVALVVAGILGIAHWIRRSRR